MSWISRAQSRFLPAADRLSFLGPTLARLTLGIVFVGTGWGKLHGLEKVTEFFTELGIPAPGFNAVLASSAELLCGALLLVGLLSRLAAIPLIVVMTVAILAAKIDNLHGVVDLLGFEEWTYIVLLLWIAVAGPGPLSLDRIVSSRTAKLSRPDNLADLVSRETPERSAL
jgi:putative oxidoreductase